MTGNVVAFPVRYRGRLPYDLGKAAAAVDGLDDIQLLCRVLESVREATDVMEGDSITDEKACQFAQQLATAYLALGRLLRLPNSRST
jgi:hypothetical protein